LIGIIIELPRKECRFLCSRTAGKTPAGLPAASVACQDFDLREQRFVLLMLNFSPTGAVFVFGYGAAALCACQKSSGEKKRN